MLGYALKRPVQKLTGSCPHVLEVGDMMAALHLLITYKLQQVNSKTCAVT